MIFQTIWMPQEILTKILSQKRWTSRTIGQLSKMVTIQNVIEDANYLTKIKSFCQKWATE